jgi:peptide/nickel transport system permease protein
MTRYLVKQFLMSLVKLFVFVTFMFFFIQLMIPGDFVDQFAIFCDAECRAAMRSQLGLDLPIWSRYLHWLGNIIRLDLGHSFYGPPIIEIMKDVIPPTLLVFVTGTALAFIIGLWLGKRTAWRGSSFGSRMTTLGGITLFTSFPPWLAWLVTYFIGRQADFHIQGEVGGLRDVTFLGLKREIWMEADIEPSVITLWMFLSIVTATAIVVAANALFKRSFVKKLPVIVMLPLIAALALGGWYMIDIEPLAFDILRFTWLPVEIYTLLSFGETMLIMQSSMTEVLKEEYITTAHAKGLPVPVVRDKHAVRNAILPVLSRLVISLPYLITGVVIIESTVGWPGLGTSLWNALYWQNMTVVMNTLLVVGLLSLFARLVLDVLTAYLDPRIRYVEGQITAT